MKTPLFAVPAAVLVLAGCASSANLNRLHVGMTKAEVTALLGEPSSTGAQGNVEYLTYYLVADDGYGRNQPYFVRLVDGRVESFGRFIQLWDLANRPVTGSQPGVPQMGTMPSPAPAPEAAPDIAQQLERLKQLKDQGVLTPEEFERAKAKVLNESR